MDTTNQLDDQLVDPKILLNQLNTARKEISNLRQQIKSLRYIFDKDVSGIKRLIGIPSLQEEVTAEVSQNNTSILELAAGSSSSSSSSLSNQQLQNGGVSLDPIGIINTGFPNKRGTPRQPGICKESRGKITLFNKIFTNPEHALSGLEDYSHMWILFHFHRNDSTHVRAKVAPPRLNGIRTGVFSTRSPHRPCPIGLSLVKIINIERNIIIFEGVDIVDGTPVFDIKPYIPQYDNPLYVENIIIRNGNSNNNNNNDNDNDNDNQNESNLSNDNAVIADSGPTNNGIWQILPDDIFRDEEIALRLQAEEFDELSTINEINNLNINDTVSIDVDTIDSSRLDISSDDDLINSRLLDGADGPNNVWGTDMDFISRRSLNTRLDNSPIRMGVREAPDGEEGMESQSLRPSQTIGNIQNISSTSTTTPTTLSTIQSHTNNTSSLQNLNDNNINDINQFQVRIPNWITQSCKRTLSVIFNERALHQLSDIVHGTIDEHKSAIENVLREDPRSVYLRQRWANQFYTFLIHDFHISCRFDDNRGIVTVFQIRSAGRICECGKPEWQCLGHSPNS